MPIEASFLSTYGKHWAPHDIQVRELASGRSRLEAAASLGIKFKIVPKGRKAWASWRGGDADSGDQNALPRERR